MNLQVVRSVKIQRKKPCDQFAWLRQCSGRGAADSGDVSKGLYVFHGGGASQLCPATGQTRPSLSGEGRLAVIGVSQRGSVVAGLTEQGHMTLWTAPSLQMATYTTPLSSPDTQPHHIRGCELYVSDSGQQGLLVTKDLEVHLWQLRDGQYSEWWKVPAPDDIRLSLSDTEHTATDTAFYIHQVFGDCCECDIVFTNKKTSETVVANLLLTWNTSPETNSEPNSAPVTENTSTEQQSVSLPVTVDWKSCTVSASDSSPHHKQPSPPSGRGCYVVRLSPTGRVAAVVVNHSSASHSHVLFLDLWNEVIVSRPLYSSTCHYTGRSWWVSSLGWSGDGVLLAAMTNRGSLLLLPRFGPPLTLIASGCGLELGPTHFLPLHPLITTKRDSVVEQEMSEFQEKDPLRQRFTVATHPHLPALLCSDGYCLTLLKLPSSLPHLLSSLTHTGQCLLSPSLGQTLLPGKKEKDRGPPVTKKILGGFDSCEHASEAGCSSGGPLLQGAGVAEKSKVNLSNAVCSVHDVRDVANVEKEKLAHAHLLSAWGLLLSASHLQAGNGVYPQPISSDALRESSQDMKNVEKLIIRTLSHSSLEDTSQHKLFYSALSMSFLDELDKRSHKKVYTLANSFLLSLLSDVIQQHLSFASSTRDATAFSVEIHARTIRHNLKKVWKMFQRVVVILAEIYSLSYGDTAHILSFPILVLKKTCSSLFRNFKECFRLVQPPHVISPGLEGREAQLIEQGVTKYISKTCSVLTSISNAITTLLCHSSDIQLVLTGLASSEDHVQSQSFSAIESVPLLLQRYQLRQALECVYSVIAESRDIASVCQMSVPDMSLVSPTVLAGQHVSNPLLQTILHLLARFIAASFHSKRSTTFSCLIPPVPNDTAKRQGYSRKSIDVAHKVVREAIKSQNISMNWTATHAVELFLLSGEWCEAGRVAVRLGDWKKGLVLCALYIMINTHLTEQENTDSLRQTQEYISKLAMGRILRELGLSRVRGTVAERAEHFISGVLGVCERAGVSGVCPQVMFHIHQRLWTAVKSLPVRVPDDFPLPKPSPPLHYISDHLDSEEGKRRDTLSQLVRSSLTVMRSPAHCIGWYSSSLVELHSLSGTWPSIRLMPSAQGAVSQLTIPSSFLKLSSKCPTDVSHSVQCEMALFRELCGLLWLLHARDRASHLVRQVFQPESNDKVAESEKTVSECVLWCARLLPLKCCHKHPSSVEDLLLSVLSELHFPTSDLLTTVLAQSFPDSSGQEGTGGGSRRLKLDQLLTRMRRGSGKDHCPSVVYQTLSQSVLADRASGTLQDFGPLCVKSDTCPHSLLLKEHSLKVGSFTFEYDQAYLDFLDSLFPACLAEPSDRLPALVQSSVPHSLKPSQNTPTKYSCKYQLSTHPKHSTSSAGLNDVVTHLYEWSQRTDSRRLGENKRGSTPVKIDLSLSFLMYCVQLEREKHQLQLSTPAKEMVDAASNDSPDGADSLTTVTLVPDQSLTDVQEDHSSLTTVTLIHDSTSSTNSALPISDTTVTPLVKDSSAIPSGAITADSDTVTQCDSTLYIEDLVSANPNTASLLSLSQSSSESQNQDDHLTLEVVSPVQTTSLSLNVSGDDLTVATAVSKSVSSGQLVEFTDSLSTGELPSQLSFSVGEFGSGITSSKSMASTASHLSKTPTLPSFGNGSTTLQLLHVPELLECSSPNPDEQVDHPPLTTDERRHEKYLSMEHTDRTTTHSAPSQQQKEQELGGPKVTHTSCSRATTSKIESEHEITYSAVDSKAEERVRRVSDRERASGGVKHVSGEKDEVTKPELSERTCELTLQESSKKGAFSSITSEDTTTDRSSEEDHDSMMEREIAAENRVEEGTDRVCDDLVVTEEVVGTVSEGNEKEACDREQAESENKEGVQKANTENDTERRESRGPSPLTGPPAEHISIDVKKHLKEILSSELKECFQEHQEQMKHMLHSMEDWCEQHKNTGKNEPIHSLLLAPPNKNSVSEHRVRKELVSSLSSSSPFGHTSVKDLHCSPPLLLLPQENTASPSHLTLSHSIQLPSPPPTTVQQRETQNILPHLQLDQGIPCVQQLVLPHLVRPAPLQELPLLTLEQTVPEQSQLFPALPFVPVSQQQPTLSLATPQENTALPLLHTTCPPVTHILSTTSPSSTATTSKAKLPLLVADSSPFYPTLPPLINLPPPPLFVVPDNVMDTHSPDPPLERETCITSLTSSVSSQDKISQQENQPGLPTSSLKICHDDDGSANQTHSRVKEGVVSTSIDFQKSQPVRPLDSTASMQPSVPQPLTCGPTEPDCHKLTLPSPSPLLTLSTHLPPTPNSAHDTPAPQGRDGTRTGKSNTNTTYKLIRQSGEAPQFGDANYWSARAKTKALHPRCEAGKVAELSQTTEPLTLTDAATQTCVERQVSKLTDLKTSDGGLSFTPDNDSVGYDVTSETSRQNKNEDRADYLEREESEKLKMKDRAFTKTDCLQPVLGGREGPEDMVKETSSGKRGDEPGVLSRLRQLECELTAIETRARTVEGELLASHQLLGTIEELQAVHKKTRHSPFYQQTQPPAHKPHPLITGDSPSSELSSPVPISQSLVRQFGAQYCSSGEGLTHQQLENMVHNIMASHELSSVSSGSVASRIDWELVDQLIHD